MLSPRCGRLAVLPIQNKGVGNCWVIGSIPIKAKTWIRQLARCRLRPTPLATRTKLDITFGFGAGYLRSRHQLVSLVVARTAP